MAHAPTASLDARPGPRQAGDLPVPDPDLGRRRPAIPVSVAVEATIEPAELVARFAAPAGLTVPTDRDVSLTGSHIRPQPGYGYDERRHVTVWGRATTHRRRRLTLTGRRAPGAGTRPRSRSSSTRSARSAQSRKYFDALSAERGTPVKPEAVVRVPDPADDAAAVPDRDDRAGRPRHPDRRVARLVRPRRGAADDHRRVASSSSGSTSPTTSSTRVRAPTTRTSRRPSSAAARGSSSTASCRFRQMATLATVFYVAGRRDRPDPARDARLDRRCSSSASSGFIVCSATPRRRSSSSIAGSARSPSRSGSGR